MAVYHIGDIHLGHEKVAKIRGFNSVEQHDDTVKGQLRELSSDDRLWLLGDLTSGKSEETRAALDFLGSLDCSLELVCGNHDAASGVNRNGFKVRKEWSQYFNSINDFAVMPFMGQDVMMSHYPYAAAGDGPDHGEREGRFQAFRLPDVGRPLIHAHTHHVEPHTEIAPNAIIRITDENGLDLNAMCVSWDARRGLTREADIARWLKARSAAIERQRSEKIDSYFGMIHRASQNI